MKTKFICKHPFEYLDAQEYGLFMCCPSWLPENIENYRDTEIPNFAESWNNLTSNKIRQSVIDGSYSFCDENICPFLNEVIHTKESNEFLLDKDVFLEKYGDKIIYDENGLVKNYSGGPETIAYGFDRSCNLKCPSCRSETVFNPQKGSETKHRQEVILKNIEDSFSESVKTLYITGSGDPVYSKLYRNYLQEFDEDKYPNLESIQLITNGVLLDEKMWSSFKSKKYINTIEISVDAGTKDTYENITRLNGDWDRVTENISFLYHQPEIKYMILSMVVSEYNYKEVLAFYDKMMELTKNNYMSKVLAINYRKIVHWTSGKYSNQDIRNISVFDKAHPLHSDFLEKMKQVIDKDSVDENTPRYVSHNFHREVK